MAHVGCHSTECRHGRLRTHPRREYRLLRSILQFRLFEWGKLLYYKLASSTLDLDGLKAMARGWESKAVADQIEEGESRQQQPSKPEATKEQRVLKERLDSLKLSRSRLLQQLDHARHPAHRNVLLNGLKAVEREIEEVSVKVR